MMGSGLGGWLEVEDWVKWSIGVGSMVGRIFGGGDGGGWSSAGEYT